MAAFELLPEQVAVHVGEADWGYFIVKYRSPLDETIQSWSSAGLGLYESCVAYHLQLTIVCLYSMSVSVLVTLPYENSSEGH